MKYVLITIQIKTLDGDTNYAEDVESALHSVGYTTACVVATTDREKEIKEGRREKYRLAAVTGLCAAPGSFHVSDIRFRANQVADEMVS